MLNILVEEGYAYDYLAILMVKGNQQELYNFTSGYIAAQVGREFHWEILTSKEFQELVDANKKTFDAVEAARYGEISAKEVDNCNMMRYNSKIALQSKFFPNKKIEEIKT
jgi:hypothetical protein